MGVIRQRWRGIVGWPYVCATRVRWFSREALELEIWLAENLGAGQFQVRGRVDRQGPQYSLAHVGTLEPQHHALVTMVWA